MAEEPKSKRRTKSVQEAAAVAELADLQVIGVEQLAALLNCSVKTVKVDASRRPETLPPRFVVPGTRKLAWRVTDVRIWSESIAAEGRRQHEAARLRGEADAQRATRFGGLRGDPPARRRRILQRPRRGQP
jgi:hypothetical protein